MRLDGLNRLVDRKAKEAGITSEWQVQEAKDIFLPIFTWTNRDSWVHAPQHELRSGADRVLTGEIANAALAYLQLDWLQDEALDWLLADAMAFGEVNSTFKTVSPQRFYFHNGEPVFWLMGLALLFRLLMWAGWLLVVVMLYSESELLAAGLVLATIAYQFGQRRRNTKIAATLASMEATYGGLDSCPPSWRNLYALMEKSRDLGAKWPTQLYRLVERKLAS